MTRYYYDTEFLEDGTTIDMISIGIVRDDGQTYYAVSQDADWARVRGHDWLFVNVVPHLPPESTWKPRDVIRAEVFDFLTSAGPPELWAYFSAYDHVALAQLWGRMIDLPSPPIPMYTHDLRSLMDWARVHRVPAQEGVHHDALADALWVKSTHEYITGRAS